MNGWTAFGLGLLLLFLLCQVRVGVDAVYAQDGLIVRARVGRLQFRVFPQPKQGKHRKEKKPAERQKKPEKTPAKTSREKTAAEKLGSVLGLVQEFVPLALEAAGCFWNRLTVDKLELCLTIGSSDPADTAMLYGQANAALGAVWQPLNQAFHVRDGRVHIQVDFDAQSVTAYGQAALSLKIGQIMWLGIYFGVKALLRLLRYKKNQKAKQQERKAV